MQTLNHVGNNAFFSEAQSSVFEIQEISSMTQKMLGERTPPFPSACRPREKP